MTWLDDMVEFASSKIDDEIRESYWGRGADDNQISLYHLGYIDQTLPDTNLPPEFLKWSGSGSKLVRSYLLPLTNPIGEVKGFQFRSVDESVRGYMDYFTEDREAVLFGLGPATKAMWETERVVLVEGAFDLFPLQRIVPEVVATLTAKVAPSFARVLRRYARKVYLSYDQDVAGKRGSSKFIRSYGQDYDEVVEVEYPTVTTLGGKVAKDPNEIWMAWGDERLADHLRCTLGSQGTEIQNAPEFF